jgi:hypothetical protein
MHMGESIYKRKILNYNGPIDYNIKKAILALLAKTFLIVRQPEGGRKEPCNQVKKRCTYIVEELLTNVHDYYKAKNYTEEIIQISLERTKGGKFRLCVSNTLCKSDTYDVLSKIETINNENTEELQEHYLKQLAVTDHKKKGHGLGLITVKLKTGSDYFTAVTGKNSRQNIIRLSTSINLA